MPDDPLKQPVRGRRILRAFALASLAIIVALGTLAWRFTQGPIALPDWAVARIEDRIARDMGARSVTIGGVALYYDVEAQAIRLAVSEAVLQDAGQPILQLPLARVALDGPQLVAGRIRPRSLRIDGLELDVGRDADGTFSLAFGQGGGALPETWAEGLAALDAMLAIPAISTLSEVSVEGVRLRFEDAVTGLSERTEGGSLTLRRGPGQTRLALTSALRLGAETTQLSVGLVRGGADGGAMASVSLTGLSFGGLAEVLPRVPALTLLRGQVSAAASMSVSEAGVPGALEGRVTGQDLRMVDESAMALDRAVLAFAWQPGSGRIGLSEITATSDDIDVRARGQILMEDGLVGPLQLQLALGRTILDPDGLLDRRIEFDQGVIETRLTQTPLALRIGQVMVTGPSGTARVDGAVAFNPDGLRGSLRLSVPEMSVADLVAIWPPRLQSQARTWFVNNMLAGRARRATALLRVRPGAPPQVAASFDFVDGAFRYMRNMPPALDTAGGAALSDNRLTLRVDSGRVAVAEAGGGGGDVDVAGTVFSILDTTERPSTGELELIARGDIGDMMQLLDNPPFRLLQRLKKDRDFVAGGAEARVQVSLPLRRGNAPADILYDVTAELTDVSSDQIVPNRTLAADALTLTMGDNRIQIAGEMTLEGMPFAGRWHQDLPPPSTSPIVPGAPPGPPVPLPAPGRVSGTAEVTPEGLARLGISVAALDLAGRTSAEISLSLPQGAPPQLTARSDLRGLRAALPAVGWSKAAETSGTFEITARLGAEAEVTAISVDAPGLSASGRISFRPGGGGLERAEFDTLDLGWFQGPLALTGRGPGAAPAIRIAGGRADLRRALLAGGAGDGGGAGAPLDISLNRLTVTEGIVLTDMTARLQGGGGTFAARVNGAAAVEGVLAPQADGSAVQIRGTDAGGVLRSAGLFQDARGGTLSLTLRPTGQTGVYGGQVRMADLSVRDAPALASLLQALSVVGILEQLSGDGLFFQTVESDFTLRPNDIVVRRASAVGPSMSITADGAFDLRNRRMRMQGVISPIYLVNGLFGTLFSRRDEGLFGFSYTLDGPADDPVVDVNPLSILTPGIFRDIFRRAPPS